MGWLWNLNRPSLSPKCLHPSSINQLLPADISWYIYIYIIYIYIHIYIYIYILEPIHLNNGFERWIHRENISNDWAAHLGQPDGHPRWGRPGTFNKCQRQELYVGQRSNYVLEMPIFKLLTDSWLIWIQIGEAVLKTWKPQYLCCFRCCLFPYSFFILMLFDGGLGQSLRSQVDHGAWVFVKGLTRFGGFLSHGATSKSFVWIGISIK